MRTDADALLAGIADGTLDPVDPRVKEAARTQEAYLRTMLAAPTTPPDRAHRLATVLGDAARAGLVVTMSPGATLDHVSAASFNRAMAVLADVLGAVAAGVGAHLSLALQSHAAFTVVFDGDSAEMIAALTSLAHDRNDCRLQVTALPLQTLVVFSCHRS